MKLVLRHATFAFIVCSFFLAASCFAQAPTGTLWQDTAWTAIGAGLQNQVQNYGYDGLSYLGGIYGVDSVTNAVAVGETGGSSWIENKKRLDTNTQYFASGQNVIRCNLSGTGRGDYVVINPDNNFGSITVLYATDTPFIFDTALVLTPKNYGNPHPYPLIADLDSSGIESLYLYSYPAQNTFSVQQYKGGSSMNSMPKILTYNPFPSTGYFTVGHIFDVRHLFLCSIGEIKQDTAMVYYSPLGKSFNFVPSDSFIVTSTGGQNLFSFFLDDINNDSIEDILLGWAGGGGGGNVLIYKGGDTISSTPTYHFNLQLFDGTPRGIYDIGHPVSSKYRSILVTDPQYGGDLLSQPGALFLFNIGNGLDSNCVSYAIEGGGTNAQLGIQAINIGKYPGQQLDNFMVAEEDFPHAANGRIRVFHGDSSYGTSISVKEGVITPTVFTLAQNYPNPASGKTTITFAILDPALIGREVTVKMYSALGEPVKTLFQSKAADGYEYTLGVSTDGLPEGNYFYRLECGEKSETKMMSIMK